jgi:hypothetical protein
LALLMATLLAGGAFAQFSLSAGGGLLFDYSGNNGISGKVEYYDFYGGGYYSFDYYGGFRCMSIGGYGFFDATYVEVDMSFSYGMVTFVDEIEGIIH